MMTRQFLPPAATSAPAVPAPRGSVAAARGGWVRRGLVVLGIGMVLALGGCGGPGSQGSRGGALAGGGADKRSAAAVEADIACTRHCNHAMAVCEDAGASRFNRGEAGFGARGLCQRQLSQCLQGCQPTPAPRSPAGAGAPDAAAPAGGAPVRRPALPVSRPVP